MEEVVIGGCLSVHFSNHKYMIVRLGGAFARAAVTVYRFHCIYYIPCVREQGGRMPQVTLSILFVWCCHNFSASSLLEIFLEEECL